MQLTDRYLRKLAPSVLHKNEIQPVYTAYQSVLSILDPNKNLGNEALKENMLEFRKQIFRDTRVKETISDWDDSEFWEHYQRTPSEWNAIDIHDRAVMKARLILKNMVEVVDRYHEAMSEKRKKKMNDGKAAIGGTNTKR